MDKFLRLFMAPEGDAAAPAAASTGAETDQVAGQDNTEAATEESRPASLLSGEHSSDETQDAEPGKEGEGEGEGEGSDEESSEDAPEEYGDFTTPEGFEISDEDLKSFHETAKDMNLSQDQAQKLLDLQANLAMDQHKKVMDNWEAMQDTWVNDVKSDSEIGGKNFDQSMANAQKARTAFGSPDLVEALEMTGAGNHPEIVRFFARVGAAISEDSMHTPEGNGSGDKTAASVLYPTTDE